MELLSRLARRRRDIELLVLQPTPFCNLDCRYCYLPDRGNRARMSLTTLETVIARVAESGRLGATLSIVWHAGEPLVVPPEWYEAAFAICRRHLAPHTRLRHCFQSNGVLLDQAWCELIRRHDVHLGISLDGPAFVHDQARRTRSGKGTHAMVMRGVEVLRAAAIPFHVICVLSRASLDHPDAIFEFFADLDITMLGFNIEEIEAVHTRSSLETADVEAAFVRFFDRFLERLRQTTKPIRLREVDRVLGRLRDPAFGRRRGNTQVDPLAIVSVDHQGRAGTFSPELLGWHDARLGPFTFVDLRQEPLERMLQQPGFTRIAAEIDRGVAACRTECAYFAFCGGGAPANKLAEHGRLDGSETLFCRLTEKRIADRVLRAVERDLIATAQNHHVNRSFNWTAC